VLSFSNPNQSLPLFNDSIEFIFNIVGISFFKINIIFNHCQDSPSQFRQQENKCIIGYQNLVNDKIQDYQAIARDLKNLPGLLNNL